MRQERGDANSSTIANFKKGISWGGITSILNAMFQLLFLAILARLLEPSDFGLVAMANIVIRFLSYFSQMGLGPAVIQKPDLSNKDIQYAVGLALIVGVIAFVFMWFSAPFAAYMFDNQALIGPVRALSLLFFVTPLYSITSALLRRDYHFKNIAIVETASYIIGYGLVTVLCAYLGFGSWSIIFGIIAQNTIGFALALSFSRHTLRPCFKGLMDQHIYKFGSKYTIIGFLEFFTANIDTMAIGRIFGEHQLGLYNRAMMVTSLPIQQPVNVLTKTLFPIFSEVNYKRENIARGFLGAIFTVGAFAVPVCLGMAVVAEDLVFTLLGDKWMDVVPILQILAVAIPISMLSHVAGITCDSLSLLTQKLKIQICCLVLFLVLISISVSINIIAVAFALVIGETIRLFMFIILLKYRLLVRTDHLLAIATVILFLGGFVALAINSVASTVILQSWSVLARLITEIITGGVILCLGLYFSGIILQRIEPIRLIIERFPWFRSLLEFKLI